MESVFNINFANPTVSSEGASLRIEQLEWAATTGFVTKAAFYQYVASIYLNQAASTDVINCGIELDSSIVSTIYVYPSPSYLEYELKTTYGALSERFIETFIQKESIHFSLENSFSLQYAMHTGAVLSMQWVGNVYNYYGNLITPPSVSFDGNTVNLNEKVYGTLLLSYEVQRHKYALTAEAREEDAEDLYGAVVYGIYGGGVSWLELSNPPYADELANGATCGGVTLGEGIDDDNPDNPLSGSGPPDSAPQLKQTDKYDYCTGDLKSSTKTYV